MFDFFKNNTTEYDFELHYEVEVSVSPYWDATRWMLLGFYDLRVFEIVQKKKRIMVSLREGAVERFCKEHADLLRQKKGRNFRFYTNETLIYNAE